MVCICRVVGAAASAASSAAAPYGLFGAYSSWLSLMNGSCQFARAGNRVFSPPCGPGPPLLFDCGKQGVEFGRKLAPQFQGADFLAVDVVHRRQEPDAGDQ